MLVITRSTNTLPLANYIYLIIQAELEDFINL